MPANTDPTPDPLRRGGRRFVVALIAVVTLWTSLVGGLAYLLYARTFWLRESDEANLREWIDEGRIFRKSLRELMADYFDLHDDKGTSDVRLVLKSMWMAD